MTLRLYLKVCKPWFRVVHNTYCTSSTVTQEMELKNVVNKLNGFASPSLAENWDNVGLLTEPSAPHTVKKILLTNDLTPPVLDEAIEKKADMVLSYHPPIFSPLKRLTQRSWKEKLIVRCLENRIAVYSPHTCYDALQGGVNDWLISAFDMKSVKPIEQSEGEGGAFQYQLDVLMEPQGEEQVVSSLKDKSVPQTFIRSTVTLLGKSDQELVKLCVSCNKADLTRLVGVAKTHPSVVSVEKRDISKVPLPGYGMGRVGKLQTPLTLQDAVTLVKTHLGLSHIRLAASPESKTISSVAVCAGSGSGVLRNAKADLFLTGEMSHHDVLNAVSNGTSVILCEHSNTERGYLTVLAQKLTQLLDQVEITVSDIDCDPLIIV